MTGAALAVAKLPLPPRQVRVRRWGGIAARCCFTLLLLPHAAIGLLLLATAAGMAALWMTGAEQTGKVLDSEVTGGKATVSYALGDGSVPLANHMTIGSETIANLKTGDEIALRSISLGSRAYAAPAAILSGKRVLLESLLAVIWLAFDVFFLLVIWRDVYREWKLVTRGAAAVDRIRDKQIRRGAFSTAYEVYFPTPAGLASMQTSAKLYAAIPNQSLVTILYDPRKPAWAIVYEMSRFKAAGDQRPLRAARSEEDRE